MKNKEAYFDNDGYQNELKQLQSEIENYNSCIDALEKITGSRELKSLDYVKEFICALTGFPAIQQSADLLNFTDEYNFLKEHLPNINTETTEITKEVDELIKEKYTTRLSDELQKEYVILERIVKDYAKLSNFTFIHTIRNTSYGVFNIDANSLYQVAQFVKR